MKGRPAPTYDLALLQAKVLDGQYVVTRKARTSAADLGIRTGEIVRCVLQLTPTDFYKSMPAERGPTPRLWQDVYHPAFAGRTLYVKLQISATDAAVVISFKAR